MINERKSRESNEKKKKLNDSEEKLEQLLEKEKESLISEIESSQRSSILLKYSISTNLIFIEFMMLGILIIEMGEYLLLEAWLPSY